MFFLMVFSLVIAHLLGGPADKYLKPYRDNNPMLCLCEFLRDALSGYTLYGVFETIILYFFY